MNSSTSDRADQLFPITTSSRKLTDVLDTARAEIDEEIFQLEQSLCTLKARRNALAPILRLPPETLSEIFIAYATTSPRSDNCSCIRIAHVCRHWRAVALQCSRLWSYVTLRNTPWAAHLLQYSNIFPLLVFLETPTPRQLTALEYVLDHAVDRVRELIVSSVPHAATMRPVWRILTKPAPALHTFILRDPVQRGIYECCVPTGLFAAETPTLCHLELRQCSWSWSSSLFGASLTTLILDARHVRMRPTLAEVLDMLARTPQLEHAVLLNICPDIPWDYSPVSSTARVVVLPRLQSLHIEALALNVATLLYSLHLPAHPTLLLACVPFSKHTELEAATRALGETLADRPPSSTLRSLSFTPGSTGLLVRAWSVRHTPEALRSPNTLNKPALELALWWRYSEAYGLANSFLYACQALPLGGLKTLYIPRFVIHTSIAWVHCLGAAKAVEEVWVCGTTACHLPAALQGRVICRCPRRISQRLPGTSTSSGVETGPASAHRHVPGLGGERAQAEPPDRPQGNLPLAEQPQKSRSRPESGIFPMLESLTFEGVDFALDVGQDQDACFFSQLQNYVYDYEGSLKLAFVRCRNFIMEQMEDLQFLGADVTWTAVETDFDVDGLESDDDEDFDYEDTTAVEDEDADEE